jgi:hypothetical protein
LPSRRRLERPAQLGKLAGHIDMGRFRTEYVMLDSVSCWICAALSIVLVGCATTPPAPTVAKHGIRIEIDRIVDDGNQPTLYGRLISEEPAPIYVDDFNLSMAILRLNLRIPPRHFRPNKVRVLVQPQPQELATSRQLRPERPDDLRIQMYASFLPQMGTAPLRQVEYDVSWELPFFSENGAETKSMLHGHGRCIYQIDLERRGER